MTRLYSKRVLLPFVGVLQVADFGWARAMSMDGVTWSIRYARFETEQSRLGPLNYNPRVNIAIILNTANDHMSFRHVRTDLDPVQSEYDCQRIFDVIKAARLPFEPADFCEYWLLDSEDDSPLALLYTCVYESEMHSHTPLPSWQALPAAELPIAETVVRDESMYHPPVNYRFQGHVDTRAGNKPRGAWLKRVGNSGNFPACLVKEQWDDPECQRLCDLYLQRLAPRLLMLAGLPTTLRQRLEESASRHGVEVDSFYQLYPEVVNDELINVARVEARLRDANEK